MMDLALLNISLLSLAPPMLGASPGGLYPGQGTRALQLQPAATNMHRLGARSQQASLGHPMRALLTPALVAHPEDNVFWIFVKALLARKLCFTSFQPTEHLFPNSSFCDLHLTPSSTGTEVDGATCSHPASSIEAQGHPNASGLFPPWLWVYPCGVATETLQTGLHEAVTRTMDGPMGRTIWKTPTGLLRAVVPHSYRRAKKSSPKTAFTMHCRGIWDRLSLVAGCQQAAGRER